MAEVASTIRRVVAEVFLSWINPAFKFPEKQPPEKAQPMK
jgi:hypothetical protein